MLKLTVFGGTGDGSKGSNGNSNNACINNNVFKTNLIQNITKVAAKTGFDVLINGQKNNSGSNPGVVHSIELQRNSPEKSSENDSKIGNRINPIDALFCGGKIKSLKDKNPKHGTIKSSKEQLNSTILKMILIMYDTRDVMIGSSPPSSEADARNTRHSGPSPAFYGISVSPIIGLMPICCNANTDVINVGKKTIVSALRVIEKGEEIRVR